MDRGFSEAGFIAESCSDLELGLKLWGGFQDRGQPVAGVGRGVRLRSLRGCRRRQSGRRRCLLQDHVDDPVGGLDDVEVVLDDEEGAAAVDELAEGAEELGYVVEVEAVVGSSRM